MPIVSNPTTQFVLEQFDETYHQTVASLSPLVENISTSFPFERPTERFTYLESNGSMRIWRRGEDREVDAFRAVSWTTEVFDYQCKTEWHRNDDQDHQGRTSIKTNAMKRGEEAARMPIRIYSQIIEGATNHELLPSVPTAPDGAAMYANAAGGSPRFGATNGNLLTGTGTTGQAISDDLFSAIEQFMSFTNPAGNVLWDPGVIQTAGITVMFPVALWQQMQEAFKWARPIYKDEGTSTTDTSTAVASTNRVRDFAVNITPWANPYLADSSDWYIFLNGVAIKPLYQGIKQPLEQDIWDRSNSDRAKDTKHEAVGWDARWAFGMALPISTIKINNS